MRLFLGVWLLILPLFSLNLYADELTDLLSGKPAETAADTSKVIATGSSVQNDQKIRQRNPFEVNDLIRIDSFAGNVASLNSRATILISPDDNHIRQVAFEEECKVFEVCNPGQEPT